MPSKNVKWLGNKLELCGNRIYKRVYIKGKNRTRRELVSWIIKRCRSCGKFLKKYNSGTRCLKCCNKEIHKRFLDDIQHIIVIIMKEPSKEEKHKKLFVKGWLENGEEEYTNIPTKCPKCGEKLRKVDALQSCGMYMVWCPISTCRWCELFKE